MQTIPIQVSGDIWNNRSQVEDILKTLVPGSHVVLDLYAEGPSLHYLGVVELIEKYKLDVQVTHWFNGVENVPFHRIYCGFQSHFYPMSRHYWTDEIANDPDAKHRFGLFVGRSTTARNRILYDAVHRWPGMFLTSKLPNLYSDSWTTNPNDVPAEVWFENVNEARKWFSTNTVSSIDNCIIQDQYKVPELSTGQMMKGLINNHYLRFNVELVCETYTLGNTFFPTEKTVRPIVGNRPFIVYGPKNYLNNLREQEGFRTFSSIWNEDYDQLEGLPRWQAIAQLIDNLKSQSNDQWADTIRQTATITQHNRAVLKKIINDRKKL